MTDVRRLLAELLVDPDRLDRIEQDQVPALLGELETIRARLWVRMTAGRESPAQAPEPDRTSGPNGTRLLTTDEAAALLGVDRRWLYRRAGRLPFARRLGPGTLRFDARGLERWRDGRRP